MTLPPGDLESGLQRLYFHSSERMPELPAASVDVIITSPPYNRGKHYHPSYSDRLLPEEYERLLSRVFRECHRVLRPRGSFFLNVGDSARDQGKSERVVRVAEEAGFRRVQTLVWVKSILGKGHYTPSGRGRNFSNIFEYVYLLARGPSPRIDVLRVGIPYADKSNIGRYSARDLRDAGNVWFIPYRETTGARRKKGHEAPFPVELPWRALRCVPGARRILDPFAGTGSTLAAAESLGIEGVGYERFPDPMVLRERLQTPYPFAPTVLLPELERAVRLLARLLEARPGGLGTALQEVPPQARGEVRSLLERLGESPTASRRAGRPRPPKD